MTGLDAVKLITRDLKQTLDDNEEWGHLTRKGRENIGSAIETAEDKYIAALTAKPDAGVGVEALKQSVYEKIMDGSIPTYSQYPGKTSDAIIDHLYSSGRLSSKAEWLDTVDLIKEADAAYCSALDIADKNCRGSQYKLENGQFGDDDLKWHCKFHEKIGYHYGMHKVIKVILETQGRYIPDDFIIKLLNEKSQTNRLLGLIIHTVGNVTIDPVKLDRDWYVRVKENKEEKTQTISPIRDNPDNQIASQEIK